LFFLFHQAVRARAPKGQRDPKPKKTKEAKPKKTKKRLEGGEGSDCEYESGAVEVAPAGGSVPVLVRSGGSDSGNQRDPTKNLEVRRTSSTCQCMRS